MPNSITCPKCLRTSHAQGDIDNKYCGACHDYHANLDLSGDVPVEPLLLSIGDARATVDADLHRTLNALARIFYRDLGYEASESLDFYTSRHPTEVNMYKLALRAHIFNTEVGLD
jgi:hypothetical protein